MACQCALTPERLKHFDGSCTGNDWFLLFFRILIYSLMSWSHITVLKNSKLKLKKTQLSYKSFFFFMSTSVSLFFSVYMRRWKRRLTWLFKAQNVGGKHNYCSDSLSSPSFLSLCAVCFFHCVSFFLFVFFLFFSRDCFLWNLDTVFCPQLSRPGVPCARNCSRWD